jgi:hypothetical protein
MKRIVIAAFAAVVIGTGLVKAQDQNPTTDCQACREAFTACMVEVRTPAEAAACRAAARVCLAACTAE